MNRIYTEALARALFEEAGDALFLFDPESEQLLEVNRMAERLSGFARAELLALPATYLFRFGGRGGKERLRKASQESGVFHSQEGYFLRTHQDGVWIPVNLTITRLHVQPQTLALITARDVRERHEAHARLEKAEAELRQVLGSVSDCLWSAEIDTAGHWSYRYCSPVVAGITGRPVEFFLKGPRAWAEAVHPEDQPRWQRWLARLRSGQPGQEEYRIVWPDGTTRWVRDSVRTTRQPETRSVRLDGVLADITERKQAEEALKKVNTFLDSIVENVPIMLFVKEAVGLSFELFNKAGERLLGYRRQDLLGKNDYDFFPRDEADFFIAKDREVLAGKQLVDIPEEAIQTREGLRLLHTMKIPILDEQGAPRYLLGISEDITERRALEELRRRAGEERERYARELEGTNRALSESERRYRQLTEATLDAIIVADGAGAIRLFNPAAERLFGYRADEVLGKSLTCLMPEEYHEQYRRALRLYRETGQGRMVGRTSELYGRRRDGLQFPLELALTALKGGGEVQFLGAIRDLSERNRMRSVLFQSEKLASIGRLSAGVAHEINNPLAYVANNLAVLERDVRGLLRMLEIYGGATEEFARTAPEAARRAQTTAEEIDLPYIQENMDRLLGRTREGLDRVTRIVQSLRAHARTAPAPRQEVNVPDLLESSLEILQGRLRRRGIEVRRHYGDCPKVLCTSTDLGQVLLNLLVNACQAIDSLPADRPGRIDVTVRREGDELLIEVADNGCGIPLEDRPRLFDPFFTTKAVGEGTGLGLWITHAIVSAHGGRIEVDSRPGEGACFRIALPGSASANSP
jgi:PAS domain S-box-containing protein